ncbi:integrase, catalytic region, zinc finger, CCHC-type containing protein [Tanacetum coccineum]
MLDKAMYNSWESRMLLYIKGKKNGIMMFESIENGPLVYPTVEEDGQIRKKKYAELTEQEQLQDDCDVQATNIVLQGLPPDVYALVNHCLAALVFLLGDDPIACLNKAMVFMTAVVASCFPSTNNQLITSYNPRNQATIQDGKFRGNNAARKARVVKCYNCQGEGNMESGQVLDEEQLAFLADPRIIDCHDVQPTIIHNAAFQTDDLDAYDSDCDDISSVKAILMANLSSYGSDVLSELNKLAEDFGKCFVPQKELPAEQAFLLPLSNPISKQPVVQTTPVKMKAPSELPKEFFTINEWQAKLDAKDVSIAKLKKHIKSLKLKNVIENDAPMNKAKIIALGMFKLDLEPLAPNVLKNKDAHIDYIKHAREHANTLPKIVEHARALRPLDSNLDSAFKYVQRIQDVLVYVTTTCPSLSKPSEKLVAVTPLNKNKKVRFTEPATSSSSTQKQVDSHKIQDSNKLVLPSTGMKSSTSDSRSQPSGNTKNNRIWFTSTKVEPLKETTLKSVTTTKPEIKIYHRKTKVANSIVLWYLDSECSKHMTGNRSQLINFVHKFLDIEVAFRKHSCYIRDLEGVDLLKESRGSNLYTLSIEDMMSSSPICLLSKASKTKYWLWHQRLSHLNFNSITALAKQGLEKHERHPQTQSREFHSRKALSASHRPLQANEDSKYQWKPDLSYLYVFGALCYPTNDSEDLGKLKSKTDIRIFVGYAPTKKVFGIYNKRTYLIIETIHVTFDELTAMASEQLSLGSGPQLLTLGTLSSGLPMFDEYFNPLPCVASPIPVVVALVPADLIGSPFSTLVDQDAPSPSTSQTPQASQFPVASPGVVEEFHDIEFVHLDNDPFFGVLILEPNSKESSSRDVIPSNVYSDNQPPEHLSKWTKDHSLDNVISNPS